jgi:hypothetical protein
MVEAARRNLAKPMERLVSLMLHGRYGSMSRSDVVARSCMFFLLIYDVF